MTTSRGVARAGRAAVLGVGGDEHRLPEGHVLGHRRRGEAAARAAHDEQEVLQALVRGRAAPPRAGAGARCGGLCA